MIHALNDQASQVIAGIMKTEEAQACFLNYCATNPYASIVYYASDMIIRGDTDAAYLVANNEYNNKDDKEEREKEREREREKRESRNDNKDDQQ